CAFAQSVTFLSKRVRQSLCKEPDRPEGLSSSASTLPPTFLFLHYSIFKERTSQTRCLGLSGFGFSPVECRSRGSLDFVQLSRNSEANFFVSSSVAAVVGEAYIGGEPSECQQRF